MTKRTWVCIGTGGVGKTTVSAALAVTLARGGQRTLVATVDPARRLGDTLGLDGLVGPTAVPGHPGLSALAPDSTAGARALVEQLLVMAPSHRERVGGSPLVTALTGGFAGMHELVALVELARLGPTFDVTVIDAAPSRHAIDLLALPARLAEVIDGRAILWLGELARASLTPGRGIGARVLNTARHWIVRALASSIGSRSINDALGLLAFAADVRPELSTWIAGASQLLAPARARIALVTTARNGAVDDVEQLVAQLAEVGHHPALVIVNRVPGTSPRVLVDEPGMPPSWRPIVERAAAELDVARAAARAIAARARRWNVPVVEIPAFPTHDPVAVVDDVATVLSASAYSAIVSPEPPISVGRSFILGSPSRIGSTLS